jgi:hypothetical protein
MDCEEARISLGVYVLGAIDPAERAMVDAHLETCQECRDELAGLTGLPALLATVSTDEALQLGEDLPGLVLMPEDGPGAVLTEPPALFPVAGLAENGPPLALVEPTAGKPPDNVRDLTAARRRRRGWSNGMLAAAAAVIVAVGSFAGAHFLVAKPSASTSAAGDPANFGPGSAWETTKLVKTSGGQGAQIRYRLMGWGLQIDTRVLGIPVGTTCDLYVITKSGQRIQAGNWLTDRNEGAVWYSGSSAVKDDDVVAFQVTTGGATPPVTIEASS